MTTIKIKGMSCQHCVASVTKAIDGVSGTSNIQVNLDQGEAHYDGDVNPQTVVEAIEKTGFEASS